MVSKFPPGVGSKFPHVIVIFGATGDLCRRKLLPGLFRLSTSGFIPGCRIIGVSLDELSPRGFHEFAREALGEFAQKITDESSNAFAASLDYVPLSAGTGALKAAVDNAERSIGGAETRRLHYLSVPPSAALSAVRMLGDAALGGTLR